MAFPDAWVFAIGADRCTGILLRLLNGFAQQGRMIDRVEAVDTGRSLRIRIQLSGIEADRAAVIAEKMRAMVGVRRVDLRGVRAARTPPARPRTSPVPLR